MIIELKKFGKILTSRPDGKEAFAAIRPVLDFKAELIKIDFSDIICLSPAWADEFFTALREVYKGKIKHLPTNNLSVIETFKFLKK